MKCCTRRRPQEKPTLHLFFPALTSDFDGGRSSLETKSLLRLHSSVFLKSVFFFFNVSFVSMDRQACKSRFIYVAVILFCVCMCVFSPLERVIFKCLFSVIVLMDDKLCPLHFSKAD